MKRYRVEGMTEDGEWSWMHVAGTLEDATYDTEEEANTAEALMMEWYDPSCLRVVEVEA